MGGNGRILTCDGDQHTPSLARVLRISATIKPYNPITSVWQGKPAMSVESSEVARSHGNGGSDMDDRSEGKTERM